jgi:hypothetical protein
MLPIAPIRNLAILALASLWLNACAPEPSASEAPHSAPTTPTIAEAANVGAELALTPPRLIEPGIGQASFANNLQLVGMRLGGFSVMLGRTTLSETIEAIGVGERSRRGQAASFESWLCYTIPRSQRIWFISNQIGGGEYITDIRAVADAAVEPDAECPALPSSFTRTHFEPNYWLGDAQAAIEQRLGEAPDFGEWRVYRNENARISGTITFVDANMMALRYADGHVAAIEFSRTTTN